MIFMYNIKLLASSAQGMVSPQSMSSHVKNNQWTPDSRVTVGQYDQANRTISKKHKILKGESDNVTQISFIKAVEKVSAISIDEWDTSDVYFSVLNLGFRQSQQTMIRFTTTLVHRSVCQALTVWMQR